jgi:hypothetical protein
LGAELGWGIGGKHAGYQVFTGPNRFPEVALLIPRISELVNFAGSERAHVEHGGDDRPFQSAPHYRAVPPGNDDIKRNRPAL